MMQTAQEPLAAGDVFTSDSVCPGYELLTERVWWSCGRMWAEVRRADGIGDSFQVERPDHFRVVRKMKRVTQWVPA